MKNKKLPYMTAEHTGGFGLFYVKITNKKIHKTIEYSPYLIADLDVDGAIVGIEIINLEE